MTSHANNTQKPGTTLHDEILEQSACLRALLEKRKEIEAIAAVIRKANPTYVFLAARGSSDNAGRYANYLWGAQNGMPIALATPSLFTAYKKAPKLSRAMVLAISQSGQSPDIVTVVNEGRRQGCLTLSITNTPNSPLAKASELVLDIQSGDEVAVAATKTYTSELMALAMLSAALADDESMWAGIKKIPEWLDETLASDRSIAQIAQRYCFMQQCVVLGRGFNYSTAFEWALKLKELAYIAAEPYSSADFQHGPIALVTSGFPVLAIASSGQVFDTMFELLERLCHAHRAELVIISDNPKALHLAKSAIPIPRAIPEWLSPIISIVPAQLFSYHLTRVKGYDTDAPRSISKITQTN